MNRLTMLLVIFLSVFLIVTCYALQAEGDVGDGEIVTLFEPEKPIRQ